MMSTIDRRRMLQLLGSLGATVAVSGVAAAASATACAPWLSEELEWQAVETLGREYLAGRSEVSGLNEIGTLVSAAGSDDVALGKLQSLMRDDYASDRMVNLSGWFVSETEARVFAALSQCRA